MICIFCAGKLDTINSRPQSSRNQVWRRRKCLRCGVLFTTGEQIDLSKAVKVGKVAFSRDKLLISLYNACRHRLTAAQDAAGLTDTVIARLLPFIREGQLAATVIVATAIPVLKRFDPAAAVQYRAYHRQK